MTTLVSPGILVSVTDESAYGSSGPGTIPLIIIATQSNKLQPGSTTTIAPGTVPANDGTLWLITSQRDALQTFGTPAFYSIAGTPQYDNELNEIGLFTLYEYLGIANQAFVLRADLDLSQLVPSTTQPTGVPVSGQNWLDIRNTVWGLFRSNGNINPAFTWVPQTPLVIGVATNLEKIAQGSAGVPIISASSPAISVGGNLVINGISIATTTSDSITSIASKINTNASLNLINIVASLFVRTQKVLFTTSTVSDVFSLRLTTSNLNQDFSFVGSTPSVLTDLGLNADPVNIILPLNTYGAAGNYAINTLTEEDGTFENTIWEKITLTTATGTTNYWFKVGSTDSTLPGWGWVEAVPLVLTGTISNPVFTPGQQFTITINNGSLITVTVPGGGALSSFVTAINNQLNSGEGTNTVASVLTIGHSNYLQITNYDSTNVLINDISNQFGAIHPLRDAGILPTNTYWGVVTGNVNNPSYVAATLLTSSAVVSTPGGTNYEVGDTLAVSGGTATTATILSVSSVQVVTASPTAGGTGYVVNDKLTFSGLNYTTSVVLNVDAIGGSGNITGLSIVQSGQYSGTPSPSTATAPTSTSGSGINSTITMTWGVNTVTISVPGNYTVYPTNPVVTTGGSGNSNATFVLTPDWLTSTSFSIDPGSGAVIIHVPASPNNTLAGVINEVNNIAFPSGPIVASTNANNQLILTNINGTSFTVEDLSGTPLGTSGIAAGVTFGRALIYQGYQPSLTVPNILSNMASSNLWINTTPGDRGANYIVNTYIGGVWTPQNIRPNTGNLPMYSNDTIADAAFGSLKTIGTMYIRYNNYDNTPPDASQQINFWNGTAWIPLVYTPSVAQPTGPAPDGTYWYNPSLIVDIMVDSGTQWLGYRNKYPATDPNGVIISSVQPISQSTGANLVDYDIWLDSDIIPYPNLYRYNALSAQWILIDNTDDATSAGILFTDARPNIDGTATGNTLPSNMVLSNYVDSDAPNALLHPGGMLLFNTRYSTNNVKVFRQNYLPLASYPDRWVTASGNKANGSPYMGSEAQRVIVVEALKSQLASNTEARSEFRYFNLLATPGYIECLEDMVSLNVDKKQVAFIVGDTPSGLNPSGTSILNWATNAADVTDNGPDGLITASPYAAVWYPWGLGTNLDGTPVLVPPSMMALRTLAYNDQVAFPWFPPAGLNRGLVTDATSVGYLTPEGNFTPLILNQGQRDVLYTNNINPIAFMPGSGLAIWGQKTLNPISSALDRINVARLICDLNYTLDNLAKPFLFELNDSQTRSNVTNAFTSFMSNYKSQRAVYDYAIVCDATNNTPTTIDLNQLWIDVAIKPEKAIEFIYIPIRILSTGAPLPGGTGGTGN